MSPEQAEGKVLDARSDIYSLGVVLYEMLAGRAPFVADTTPAVMYKHVHEPPPLDELPSDLPQEVVAVVEKALAKEREARYQSVAEMARALEEAIEAEVKVTPIPPRLEVPVHPLAESVAVAKEEPRPPIVQPAPKAVPKKAVSWVALLAGGLVLLGILCIIVFVISYIAALTPTPAPPVGAKISTKAPTPTESTIPPTPEPTPTPTPELTTKVPTPTESPVPPTPELTPTPTPELVPEPLPPVSTATPTPLVVPVPEGGGTGKIAFHRIFGDGIYILNPDGSRNRLARLSDQPAWSPDGRRLVFLRYPLTSNYPNQIYIMQADGTGETPLTSDRANNNGPVWSPDGEQIAFSSGEFGKQDLYLINVDGTGLKNLTNSPDTGDKDPTWSPDGERIAFSSNRDGYYDIHIMNADGTQSFPLKTGAAPAGFPAWSPDGMRIAFESERDGNTEIYVINIDGTGLKNLTNNPATDGDPAWSPNSARIAFVSSRGNDLDVYVMNADGTQVIRLTNNGGNYGPVWQP
jgi:TolB protein